MSFRILSTSKPSGIALFDAVIITVIATILYVVVMLVMGLNTFQPLFAFIPGIFIASYLVIKYSINIFIYEKIKVIYRTIGSQKTGFQTISEKKRSGEDVLEIVNQAVLQWSTEQKKELADLRKMAKYRREFIGNVSHELKTPIFNIQGYILTLLDGGLYDEEINVKYLEQAKKSVNRMIAIVEDLEEISKFESGELKLKKQVFDIHDLIRDVIEYLEMKAGESKTKLIFKSLARQSCQVKADKERVRQVLINLIDNAIKYGNPDKAKVEISTYDFHDYYLIEISDNGIGIPEEFLYRVFERFFRTDLARSRKTGGSGLGLAIVKHIIEAHNQKISVRNNPDKGTTFSFSLQKA